MGKYKKFLLAEIRVNLFIWRLDLKSWLGRINQESSQIKRNVFISRLYISSIREYKGSTKFYACAAVKN